MTTLLLPCAGNSSRFSTDLPKWLLRVPTGETMVRRSASDVLNNCPVDRIIIGIRTHHDKDHQASETIRQDFAEWAEKVEIIQFDEPTDGPAHTVQKMIEISGVSGPVCIKDADSFVKFPEPLSDSYVATLDLRKRLDLSQVAAKSFVDVSENEIVTNIVEKNVISNYVSVGAYGFDSADQFMSAFTSLVQEPLNSEIFVSHVVIQSILEGHVFKAIEVTDYIDVGTERDWETYLDAFGIYVIDADQLLGTHTHPDQDIASPAAIRHAPRTPDIQILKDGMNELIFISSAKEDLRNSVADALQKGGFDPKILLMGINRVPRQMVTRLG